MGFNIALVIVSPDQQHTTEGIKIWRSRDVIAPPHLTRLSKISAWREKGQPYPAWTHGAACVVQVIRENLYTTLAAAPTRADFAPHMLVYTRLEYTTEALAAARRRQLCAVLDPGPRPDDNWPYVECHQLRSYEMQRHNQYLAFADDALIAHARKMEPVLQQPIMWAPCSTVAAWLQAAEDAGHEAWHEANWDPLSLGVFTGWRGYFQALGPAEAHVVFVFH